MLLRTTYSMRARRSLIRVSLAVSLQLVCALIPPSGLLLCFGADGHFDVEAPHEGRACHDGPGASNPTSDCRDVALAAIEATERLGSRLDVLASPALIVECPVVVAPPSVYTCAPLDSPPLDFFTREARSNVVLLV